MNNKDYDVSTLERELSEVNIENAKTELDIRRCEMIIKKVNAQANLEKQKLEFMKLQLQQKSMEISDRRLALEEIQGKYNIISDMVRKSDKTQRAIGKTMIGFFSEQDKQVLSIMKAAKKLQDLDDE